MTDSLHKEMSELKAEMELQMGIKLNKKAYLI